jgi:hypothetical protein
MAGIPKVIIGIVICIIQPKAFLVKEKVRYFARTLSNTTWVQYVSPNVNVLYGNAWLDLTKGPVVLKIPPIPHRYYVMQFMDAFGSVLIDLLNCRVSLIYCRVGVSTRDTTCTE